MPETTSTPPIDARSDGKKFAEWIAIGAGILGVAALLLLVTLLFIGWMLEKSAAGANAEEGIDEDYSDEDESEP